jgi:hypothetical protein
MFLLPRILYNCLLWHEISLHSSFFEKTALLLVIYSILDKLYIRGWCNFYVVPSVLDLQNILPSLIWSKNKYLILSRSLQTVDLLKSRVWSWLIHPASYTMIMVYCDTCFCNGLVFYVQFYPIMVYIDCAPRTSSFWRVPKLFVS